MEKIVLEIEEYPLKMDSEIEENPETANNENNINNHELTNDSYRIENKQVTNCKPVKKQYSCNICNKSFIRKIYLNNHLRRHEKEYTCGMCNKQFAQSDALKTHMKIHTDEKMHQCHLCERRFSRKCHLVNHLKTHTKQQLSQHRPNDSKIGIIQQPQIRKFNDNVLDEEGHLKIENDNCNKSIGNERDHLSNPLDTVNSTINTGTNENEIINEIRETNGQLNASVIKKEMIEIEEHPVKIEDPIENDANGKLFQNQKNLFIKKAKLILQNSLKTVLQKSIANSPVMVNDSIEINTSEECMNEANRVEHSICTNDEDKYCRDTLEIDNNKDINVTKLQENVKTEKIDQSCHISSNNDNFNLPICNENSRIIRTNKTDHMEDQNHFGKNYKVENHTVTTIVGQNRVTDNFLTEESIDVVGESSKIEFPINKNEHKENCTYSEKNSTQTDIVNEVNETKQLYDSIEKEEMIEIEEHLVKMEDPTDNNANEKLSHNQKSIFVKGAKLFLQHTVKNILHKSTKPRPYCEICCKEFPFNFYLKRHLETHATEKLYQCEFCSKKCYTRETLKRHLNVHQLHSCHICNRIYGRKSHLQVHLRTHSDERPHECDVCEMKFRTWGLLKRHLEGHIHRGERHNEIIKSNLQQTVKQSYLCDICGTMFETRYVLNQHLGVHREGYRQCNICNKKIRPRYFKAHLKLHDKKRYQCERCGKQFVTESYLKRHLNVHTRGRKCRTCSKIFRDDNEYKQHLTMHTNEGLYQCDICGKQFAKLKDRQRHLLSHTTYHCKRCDEKFQTLDDLRKHSVGNPCLIQPHDYTCDTCGKQFAKKTSLKCHLKLHTGEGLYKCDHCAKKYSCIDTFKYHLLSHTGEKNFKCNVCDRKFLTRKNLRHHAIVHTGEQPYSCDICGKKCSRKDNLRTHLMIHSGEKPFQCNICDKRFLYKHVLRDHLKVHTGARSFDCKKCGVSFLQKADLSAHKKQEHKKK